MSPISLVLEITLAGLLAACLFYCWRLDRKLTALRSGGDGIRAAARELNQAVAQAEAAIRQLRGASEEAGRDLQARIDAANTLAERLGIGVGRIRTGADVPARARAPEGLRR